MRERPRFAFDAAKPVANPAALDLRAMVFHVTGSEAKTVERTLRQFGALRRGRGSALAKIARAAARTARR